MDSDVDVEHPSNQARGLEIPFDFEQLLSHSSSFIPLTLRE
jgi:hypothetical protein